MTSPRKLGQGWKVPEVCRTLEVSEQTYYRWPKAYGGLKMEQAKRLKELEQENAVLLRAEGWRGNHKRMEYHSSP